MSSNSSKAFATRLPPDAAQKLTAIIEATDQTEADVVRQALLDYIERNPDGIPEVYPEGSMTRFWAEMAE